MRPPIFAQACGESLEGKLLLSSAYRLRHRHAGQANAVLVQPTDGKIVAAGFSEDSSGYNQFALTRYNSDGSPDSTFGTGGEVVTDMATKRERDSRRGPSIRWQDYRGRRGVCSYEKRPLRNHEGRNCHRVLPRAALVHRRRCKLGSISNAGEVFLSLGSTGRDVANAVALETVNGVSKIVAMASQTA